MTTLRHAVALFLDTRRTVPRRKTHTQGTILELSFDYIYIYIYIYRFIYVRTYEGIEKHPEAM
jgi:hypothetical protein